MKNNTKNATLNNRQNGHQHSKKNGKPHLLQNGVVMGNGFLPHGNNRIGPMPTNLVDPLRRMYTEVEGAGGGDDGPPTNLHI